jgi:hypothetical protein
MATVYTHVNLSRSVNLRMLTFCLDKCETFSVGNLSTYNGKLLTMIFFVHAYEIPRNLVKERVSICCVLQEPGMTMLTRARQTMYA